MLKFFSQTAFICVLIVQQADVNASPTWMAIIGDSTVTGAATNPSLEPYFLNLLDFVFRIDLIYPDSIAAYENYPSPLEFHIAPGPIPRLHRITYSKREYGEAQAKGNGALIDLRGGSKLSRALDTAEYSFGYLIGRGLGVPANKIVLVAQDGKKITSMADQVERIFDTGSPTLPPILLISYGLNDICHPNDVAEEVSKFKARFKQTVFEQVSNLVAKAPDSNGTTVMISAPLDATNLMDNEELLSQKISFQSDLVFHQEITCKDLRDKTFADRSDQEVKMRQILISECRGLRGPTPDMAGRVRKVRELQNAQMEAWREVIESLQTKAPGFHLIFADSIRKIHFASGDLANDCFHPSIAAHTKIARQFLGHELLPLEADSPR
jgi:hypothetical protein